MGAPDVNEQRVAVVADGVQRRGGADVAGVAAQAPEDALEQRRALAQPLEP